MSENKKSKAILQYIGIEPEDLEGPVAYVAYGSNKKLDRFRYYIEGGDYHYIDANGKERVKHYEGCSDKDMPTEQYRCNMAYKTYFANSSSIWQDKGVAFLDPRESKSGDETKCRAYILPDIATVFEIAEQEGVGENWYNLVLEVGTVNGYRAFTVTNAKYEEEMALNEPSAEYLKTIAEGDKECEALPEAEFYGTIFLPDDEDGAMCTLVKEYR